MIYQLVYSSESTMPMQLDDLEEILEHARASNAAQGITGALIYAEGIFLQILEGDRVKVEALMARIRRDLRHQTVAVLREEEIPLPAFGGWKMAYVSATPEQVSKWAGLCASTETIEVLDDNGCQMHRTAQFAQDILSLLKPDETTPTKVD